MSVFKHILNQNPSASNPEAEMGFLDHLETLRWHIIRSLSAVVIAAIVVFIKVEWLFENLILAPTHRDFASYIWFCKLGEWLHYPEFCLHEVKMKFQNTSVTGQFTVSMSVSMMLGFIAAFPYIIWELWRFIKPALKPNEIKAARGGVIWCSLLFFLGVLFSYYILVPYTINFFAGYTLSKQIENIITFDNYYETMSNMLLAMGLVFELPVIIFFLSKIGLLSPQFMRKQRRYAFLILFLLSELITPPDLFSCLFVFIPLYGLYELSIFISKKVYNPQTTLLDK
ncbi:MAG: twin-arginine translocase subunit TatC [Chitinophagia bacterium]|nr:twin-arginine translocase subunit TatC [Chitinophagia bacterium]